MKSSDKPEISSKWWSSEKPDDVEGKDLKKCLADAEKAVADADKRPDEDSIAAAIAALEAVDAAAAKTIKKECDKKKHKDLIAVLEKYEKLVADETERLEGLQESADAKGGQKGEEEDEDDDKGILKPEYLERMIKQLRSGNTLQFCFGLNKQTPEDSRLLLCNKRKAERLFKMVKQTGDFSNRLLTYGTATGDGKVLQFQLSDDAKEPSQIVKLAKQFLRNNKELKYKKLRVIAGGQTFEEDFPEEGGNLEQQLARLQNLVVAWRETLRNVSGQIDSLRKSIDGQNDPMLKSVSDGLANVMGQFPDLDLTKLVAAAQANDRATYDRTLTQTAKEVRDVQKLLANGPLLSTIDENPFMRTDVHATVNSTLQKISDELGVSA